MLGESGIRKGAPCTLPTRPLLCRGPRWGRSAQGPRLSYIMGFSVAIHTKYGIIGHGSPPHLGWPLPLITPVAPGCRA